MRRSVCLLNLGLIFTYCAKYKLSNAESPTQDYSLEDLGSKFEDTNSQGLEQYIPVKDPTRLQDSLSNLRKVTQDDLTDDLESWEPPLANRKSVTYYFSGYDYEDRPIWVVELGKMDMRPLLAEGPAAIPTMDKFCRQATYRILKSFRNSSLTNTLLREGVFIIDADGYNLQQVAHVPSIGYLLRIMTMYSDLVVEFLHSALILNTNTLMHILINLARPIFSETMEKVEIYGTNKASWLPLLRSRFPIESMPPWYGGTKDYKPIAVYSAQ